MTRTTKGTAASGAAEWAGVIAAESLATVDAAETAQAARLAESAALKAAVQAHGERFLERVAAECGAAGAAFNTATKATIIEAPRLIGSGPGFSVRAGDQGFVLVVAYLSLERGAPAPGCTVHHRIHGREASRPFDFVLTDDGALAMRCDGDVLEAEAFAERTIAPWLRQLDVARKA